MDNSIAPKYKAQTEEQEVKMTWIIVTIALIGTVLNAQRKWQGFLFWFVSNGYLCTYNAIIGEYAQSSLFGAYLLLTVYGIHNWKKKERNQNDD